MEAYRNVGTPSDRASAARFSARRTLPGNLGSGREARHRSGGRASAGRIPRNLDRAETFAERALHPLRALVLGGALALGLVGDHHAMHGFATGNGGVERAHDGLPGALFETEPSSLDSSVDPDIALHQNYFAGPAARLAAPPAWLIIAPSKPLAGRKTFRVGALLFLPPALRCPNC
jgi:hypothetical protein